MKLPEWTPFSTINYNVRPEAVIDQYLDIINDYTWLAENIGDPHYFEILRRAKEALTRYTHQHENELRVNRA